MDDRLIGTLMDQRIAPQTAATPKVAIQGDRGSWSHSTVKQHLGQTIEPTPHAHFADALHSLRTGAVDLAVLPVHNAIIGPIAEMVRLLEASDLEVIAEVETPIRHVLATVSRVDPATVTHVHSQQPALDQCQGHLEAQGLIRMPEADTAMAATRVAQLADPRHAALCSEAAAALNGLVVVARDVADDPDNLTRFAVVAMRSAPSVPR